MYKINIAVVSLCFASFAVISCGKKNSNEDKTPINPTPSLNFDKKNNLGESCTTHADCVGIANVCLPEMLSKMGSRIPAPVGPSLAKTASKCVIAECNYTTNTCAEAWGCYDMKGIPPAHAQMINNAKSLCLLK